MRKTIILIAIVLSLSGCSNTAAEDERLAAETRAEVAEARAEVAEAQVSQLKKQAINFTDELTETKVRAKEAEEELLRLIGFGFSDPVQHNQNTVVENPVKNRVTFEIDERLVGRYIVEDDPEMYFEIKPDGKAEITLNEFEGYGNYGPQLIQLTAYYSEGKTTEDFIFSGRVYINFNLVSGKWTFPARCGLSLTFCDDYNNFDSFESISYWPRDKMKFVKQN